MLSFYQTLSTWSTTIEETSIWASIPNQLGNQVTASITVFADDVAKRVVSESCGNLHHHLCAMTIRLEAELNKPWCRLNRSKTEVLPSFVGPNDNTNFERLKSRAKACGCRMQAQAVYLGFRLLCSCPDDVEVSL
jgi:hypothetical protein